LKAKLRLLKASLRALALYIEGKVTTAGWIYLKAKLRLLAAYTEGKVTAAGWLYKYSYWLDMLYQQDGCLLDTLKPLRHTVCAGWIK
jgi:hypothetical protein